jgi:hypothetical protein
LRISRHKSRDFSRFLHTLEEIVKIFMKSPN